MMEMGNLDPYKDGLDAAYRQGRYENARDVPPCPWPSGSPEYDTWWLAFGDGTEDLIAWRISDWSWKYKEDA